jgi:PAS domain S-box-containing protein
VPVPPGAPPGSHPAAAEPLEPAHPEVAWELMARHPDAFLALEPLREGQGRLRDCLLRFANAAAATLLGQPLEGLCNRSLLQVLPEARSSRLLEHLGQALDTGHSQVEEVRLYQEGSARWLRVAMAPQAHGLAVWLNDITRRKREEHEASFLAGASHLLATSLDFETTLQELACRATPMLGDAFILQVVDGHGQQLLIQVAAADPVAESLLKQVVGRYQPEVDCGRSEVGRMLLRGEPWLMPEMSESFLQAFAQDAEHLRLVQALGVRSGLGVPLRARGRVLGALVLLAMGPRRRYGSQDARLAEDLAVRVALAVDNALLYREAREAVRHRDEFLTVAAHELRTPTTSLKLSAQSLLRGARRGEAGSLPPQFLSRLESIDRNASRLNALVNELLDVTRLHSGRLRLEREAVDLAELTREVVSRFEYAAAQAGCALEVLGSGPAQGLWDRVRLEQVVTNLLSNALKYGAGKPVHVRVEADEAHARLVVADEGIGISPESLPRLFHRFERAVSERHYGGLGLGLYITRQIVEALGGTVSVQSTPGAGSTFTVELPRTPAA